LWIIVIFVSFVASFVAKPFVIIVIFVSFVASRL